MRVSFILDGDVRKNAEEWPFVPTVGDVIDFGVSGEDEDTFARVTARWYYAASGLWEIHVARDNDDDMTDAESEAWRRAGFEL